MSHYQISIVLLGHRRSASVGANFKLVNPMSLALSILLIKCMVKSKTHLGFTSGLIVLQALALKFQNELPAHKGVELTHRNFFLIPERKGVDEEAPAHHRSHREGTPSHRDQHTNGTGHAREPCVTS